MIYVIEASPKGSTDENAWQPWESLAAGWAIVAAVNTEEAAVYWKDNLLSHHHEFRVQPYERTQQKGSE